MRRNGLIAGLIAAMATVVMTAAPAPAVPSAASVTGAAGPQSFRVVLGGSSRLTSATGTRPVSVYPWTRRTDLEVVSTDGSRAPDASPSTRTDIDVAGVTRRTVLAGYVPAGGTGVATFAIHKHCTTSATSRRS